MPVPALFGLFYTLCQVLMLFLQRLLLAHKMVTPPRQGEVTVIKEVQRHVQRIGEDSQPLAVLSRTA